MSDERHWRIVDRQRHGRTLPRRFASREEAERIIEGAGHVGVWEAVEFNAAGKRVRYDALTYTAHPRCENPRDTPTYSLRCGECPPCLAA